MRMVLGFFLLTLATSTHSQLMSAPQAHEEVEKVCSKGCVVFSLEEIQDLEAAVDAQLQANTQKAYEHGYKEAMKDARANSKICPKNI